MILSQRSCDALTGAPYDYAWACYVYQIMYSKLLETYSDLKAGLIHWNIDSLHIYERSESLIKKFIENNYKI
jgi:thymidylate synthase